MVWTLLLARVRGPHSPTPTEAGPLWGGYKQAGESCMSWGRTATGWMTKGRTKNTKAKRPLRGWEGENHENTGSTTQAPAASLRFCGPSPTKTEASRFCLMPLAHYGCPIGEKALLDGQQVHLPNVAKKMVKNCQLMAEISRKSSKRHQFWPTGLFFRRLGLRRSFLGAVPWPNFASRSQYKIQL